MASLAELGIIVLSFVPVGDFVYSLRLCTPLRFIAKSRSAVFTVVKTDAIGFGAVLRVPRLVWKPRFLALYGFY